MFTFPAETVAVTARQLCPRPLWEQIPRIRQAGITRVILREKDLSPDEYTALAEKVLRACEECGVTLVIHNFPETARQLGLDRLHMPLPKLTEELCREFGTVGTSIHSAEQLEQAQRLGAKYAAAGHIFPTGCKPGLPPRGLDFLADICRRAEIPVGAIGGINEENAAQALDTGAKFVYIMSKSMLI